MRRSVLQPTALAALAISMLAGETCRADLFTFRAELTGASAIPANGSPGVGVAIAGIDSFNRFMQISVEFSNLTGPVTAARVHAPPTPANVPIPPAATPSLAGFPLAVTAGSYTMTFALNDPSTYDPAYITAAGGLSNAESWLALAFGSERAFFNISTAAFPEGEIRGRFMLVPTPAATAPIALAGLAGARRRR
ncbi:MAG: CHRD domain-containing protein [Phycisphaerales bacterium]